MRLTIIGAFLVGSLVATAQAGAQRAAAVRDTNVVLHPGDMVKVTVWRNTEMSGDFMVGVNGALRHPLYQEVPIAGMPLHEVEQRLKTFLTKYEQNPQIVVEPLFQVTVGGQVRTPNLYPLPRTTTISQAIALAGGVTPDGQLNKVKLFRGGREYEVDLTDPSGRWTNEPVQSGDQLIVSKKGNFFTSVFLPLIGVAGSVASIINVARRR
ncbi:MAG TPA: SLBB domain-containing protein [Gemmatimonadaceae bacterium]|nr:SLBB domain-containing protein [Gemmatimonadaceae bacterium]